MGWLLSDENLRRAFDRFGNRFTWRLRTSWRFFPILLGHKTRAYDLPATPCQFAETAYLRRQFQHEYLWHREPANIQANASLGDVEDRALKFEAVRL